MHKISFFFLIFFFISVPFNSFGEEVQKKNFPAGVPIEKGGALLPKGRLVLEPSIQYSHYSQDRISISGYTVFQAILIGRVDVSSLKRDILIPSLTARAGFKDLQLSLKTSWLFRRDQAIAAEEKEVVVDDNALGDVQANMYYHLVKEKKTMPDILVNLGVQVPTGQDPYGLKTEVVEEGTSARPVEFPTGSGHWGVSGGISFIKTIDPAVLSLNLNYYYNIERDVGFEGGIDYGTIDPGDTFEYSLGSVFALNEKLFLSFSFDQRFVKRTKQNGKKLEDTSIVAAFFNIGMSYAISDTMSFDTLIGMGLTEGSPDVTVQFRFPVSFLF